MKFKRIHIILLSMLLILIALSIAIYPKMPQNVAVHWNAQGEVDGYQNSLMGLSVVPAIILVLIIVHLLIVNYTKKIDLNKFESSLNHVMILTVSFMSYIQILTILVNLSINFNFITYFMIGLGIMIYALAQILETIPKNYFVGIRTPWTIKNNDVWKKTHKIGSTLFKYVAMICVLGIFVPIYAIYLFLISIIGVSIFLIFYSAFISKNKK